MAASVSAFDSVLLTLYPKKAMVALAETVEPMLGVIDMRDDFGGSERRVAIQYGTNQSVGVTFASVQGIEHSDLYTHFNVTRGKYYGFAQYERELFEALQSQPSNASLKANLVNGMKTGTDGVLVTLKNELGRQIHSHHGGAIARLTPGTAVNTQTVVVRDAKSLKWIKKGMRLQASTADGRSGAVKAGYVTVASIDIAAATITISQTSWDDAGAIPTIAASDYLFRAYTFGATLYGWEDWIGTAPTGGDNFFGVDRTVALDELSGIRITGTATTIEDNIQDALAEGGWRGADTVTHAFMHVTKWRELNKELGSRIRRDDPVKSKRAGVGYSALYVTGQNGAEIPVMPSANVPTDKVRFIDASDWTIDTLGGAPSLIKHPATGTYLRERDTADVVEARAGWLGQLHCRCPNHQIDLTLP